MKSSEFLFALCLSGFVFHACQNNDLEVQKTVLTESPEAVSIKETQIDETLNDVDLLVDEAISQNNKQLRSTSADSSIYLTDCPIVSIDALSDPQVMTIDFGDSCVGKDGKTRSGKIIVTANTFKTFPSVRVKTFDNYCVNGKLLEGFIRKTLLKDSLTRVKTALIQEDIVLIDRTDNDTVTRQSSMTRQYLRRVIADKTDNQVVSWGVVTITRPSGVVATKTIAELTPLVFQVSCKQIVSGIARFENSKGRQWSIDYGDGSCDNKAILTENGISKEIELR